MCLWLLGLHNMKKFKFVLKCIVALLPVIAVVLYTALFPFGYMDIEYPSWKYTKEMTKKASADTIILGDSRAMADLVPSEFDTDTVNLAVGGATSIEMYYTLNSYIKNNGCPENIIVMFAPFHYSIIDNFWTRTAYFNYLSVSDMSELFSYAKACNSETLIKKGYKDDLLSYRLRFPDKYLPALINSELIGRYSENSEEYNKISADSGYGEFGTAKGCSDLNYETGYEQMHRTGDALLLDVYLNKLLCLIEENNLNAVLTIPPMNESSYNNLKPSYKDDFYSYLKNIKSSHPGISVETKIPVYDDKYFGDSSHLNNEGALLFTKDYIENH